MDKLRFDRKTWNRLITLAKPLFYSELKWQARGMLLLLAGFSISLSSLNVVISFINRDFMTALSLKQSDEFLRQLWYYLFAFACVSTVAVFYRYTEERFALMWRRWLSLQMLRRYFSNRSFYKINSYEGIDNPDQRIEEDIRSFTVSGLSFLLIVFNSTITIFAFTRILWMISVPLTFAVVLYAFFGSLFAYLLGRPLIGLNFAQLKKEADYRYKLVNIRDNAESIAFYKGERKEFTRVRQRLKGALANLLRIIKRNRSLSFFTTNYNYLIPILPTVIVAPQYLRGEIEFGVVVQAGVAFSQVVNALSIIVLNFGSLSALTAVVTRLGTFWEALEEVNREKQKGDRIKMIEGPQIAFREVTIYTPKYDQVLLEKLDLELEDQSLLITGASGSGKSSILRVVAGLWSSGRGIIVRPNLNEALFLPQRPYMVLGSFRSQLLYAQHARGFSDPVLQGVINTVGLGETFRRIGGFEAVHDWPNFLSTGEQQRLAFARLLLAKTKYAFLDEATTAVHAESEEQLYTELRKFAKTYISVGYRASLGRHHDLILELKGDGSWTLEQAKR